MERYYANHDEILKRRKEYRLKNKDKIREQDRKYRQKSGEDLLKRKRAYHHANKDVIAAKRKPYRLENSERIKEVQALYRKTNKDKRDKWFLDNRQKIYEYRKHKRNTDPQYKIACCVRVRVKAVLKGQIKCLKTLELIGCSLDHFKKHIESQFKEGMSWRNHGLRGWHLDHVKPCASFDLSQKEEQMKCFHYTNIQPLWAMDNWKKGDSWYE